MNFPINQLPLNKIILASFAFALTHWQQIGKISIFPALLSIPFLSLLPTLITTIENIFATGTLQAIPLPDNMFVFTLLFFYAYALLSVNVYRLVMLADNQIIFLLSFKKMFRFAGLTVFIGMATLLPVMLTGFTFLQLLMYFLIIPLTLNFINIAIDTPLKYQWKLPFPTQVNLFFLQVVLPAIVSMLLTTLLSTIGMPMALSWIVKTIVFYWSLISLTLCYQLIVIDNQV